MNKERYNIVIEEAHDGWYSINLEDHHGNWNMVYEETLEQAVNYARMWMQNAEERKNSKDIESKAMAEMIKLDREAGITSEYNDCLD